MEDFKNIHLGACIKRMVKERMIGSSRMMKFMKLTEAEIEKMYQCRSLDTEVLLRWSKLLQYDFFRLYSQHMILYAPMPGLKMNVESTSVLPQFRKNIYTPEIIEFILELIDTKKKTKQQVINEYKIPKTTLYKWISKYRQRK